ncbi:hypothetical protein CcaCcLH18_13185 [Colletotrichum camelliae]|nr:hypothetical protein CcaCcLH18_13185 [Colletotrichum camelliae]
MVKVPRPLLKNAHENETSYENENAAEIKQNMIHRINRLFRHDPNFELWPQGLRDEVVEELSAPVTATTLTPSNHLSYKNTAKLLTGMINSMREASIWAILARISYEIPERDNIKFEDLEKAFDATRGRDEIEYWGAPKKSKNGGKKKKSKEEDSQEEKKSKPKPKNKPENKPDNKPDTKPENKPEHPKPDQKREDKPEQNSENKPEDPKPDQKREKKREENKLEEGNSDNENAENEEFEKGKSPEKSKVTTRKTILASSRRDRTKYRPHKETSESLMELLRRSNQDTWFPESRDKADEEVIQFKNETVSDAETSSDHLKEPEMKKRRRDESEDLESDQESSFSRAKRSRRDAGGRVSAFDVLFSFFNILTISSISYTIAAQFFLRASFLQHFCIISRGDEWVVKYPRFKKQAMDG